jgi:hypothetical protein
MTIVLSNKYLIANVLTRNLTRDITDRLPFDYGEIYNDLWTSAKNYKESITLDKRAIAVGTVGDAFLEEMYATDSFGWSDACYVYTEHYPQMLYQLKKPSSVLIHGPDTSFGLVAAAAADQCRLAFLNNKYLDNFEKFVLNQSDYIFDVDYDVYDLQEFNSGVDETFDMIFATSVDFAANEDLLQQMLGALAPGGAMVIYSTNGNLSFYDKRYYMDPIMKIFNIIESNEDINTYHLTNNQGYNVIIKN